MIPRLSKRDLLYLERITASSPRGRRLLLLGSYLLMVAILYMTLFVTLVILDVLDGIGVSIEFLSSSVALTILFSFLGLTLFLLIGGIIISATVHYRIDEAGEETTEP